MDSPSHIMQQAQGSCSVHTHGSQSHKGFVHFSLVQSIPTIFPPKHLALARILFCHYIIRSDNDYIHMNHIYLSCQQQQNRHKSFHNEIHVHNFYSASFNLQHIIHNHNPCIFQEVVEEVPALTYHQLAKLHHAPEIRHNEIYNHNFYSIPFSLHLQE